MVLQVYIRKLKEILNRIWLKVTKLNLLSIEIVYVNIKISPPESQLTMGKIYVLKKNRISSVLELIMIPLNAVIMA